MEEGWAVEGACHSDCSGHTRTLEPHTDNSWPHATCLDTLRILTIPRLKRLNARESHVRISVTFVPPVTHRNYVSKKELAVNFIRPY